MEGGKFPPSRTLTEVAEMPKVQIPFTERKQVNRIQIQTTRPVGIGNRRPDLVFVQTPTDPRGHFHTKNGTCLKYGC